jgi:hypothetical protein
MHSEVELVPCDQCCATGMKERYKEQCNEFRQSARWRFRYWRCQLHARHTGPHRFPPERGAAPPTDN